ncbi:MAG: GNAT family N-acetyltransferase [Actinobacteria bacterium]|nr:GNAT family N-acetyltransferase [Actinomycetota bacterium]
MKGLTVDIKLKDSNDFSKEDIEQLVELYQELRWTNDRRPSEIAEMLANSTVVLSLWNGRKLIGFARVLSDMVYRATVWDIVVRPEYQGKGLGRELVEAVLNHPRLARVEKFWLVTAKPDFYHRFGFVKDDDSMVLTRETRE